MTAKIIIKPLARVESPDGPIYATEVDGVVVHGGKPLTPESKECVQTIIEAARRHHAKAREAQKGKGDTWVG